MQALALQARQLEAATRALGWSGVMVATYARLLIGGPATLKTLLGKSRSAVSELRFALAKLGELGLVASDRDHSKDLWYASDPAFAWLSLLAEAHWAGVVDLTPVTRLGEQSGTDETQDARRRAMVASTALWQRSTAIGRHRMTEVTDERVLANLLIEGIRSARTNIRALAGSPRQLQVHEVWPSLFERIESGITYKRITDLEEVAQHGLAVVQRDLEIGVQLRVLGPDQLRRRGYLVDRRTLVTFDPDQTHLVGRLSSDRHAIERFLTSFEQKFAVAMPGQAVVAALRSASEGLLTEASSVNADSQSLLLDLIDFGRFSRLTTREGWPVERRHAALAALRERSLIEEREGHWIPSWRESDLGPQAAPPDVD